MEVEEEVMIKMTQVPEAPEVPKGPAGGGGGGLQPVQSSVVKNFFHICSLDWEYLDSLTCTVLTYVYLIFSSGMVRTSPNHLICCSSSPRQLIKMESEEPCCG
ncbi:hypothetical protein Tco_1330063 [Tanacetum coccineum]